MFRWKQPPRESPRWMGSRLSVKLIALLLTSLGVVFATLGYLNIRHHRGSLESATLVSAERISDVIKRSTSYYMLRNDRDGLHYIIDTMADEPGMVRIRIFNQDGYIRYSSDHHEVNTLVDKRAEACYGCHAQAEPLVHLDRPDRFRIYQRPDGERVLAIINPIENMPSCSSAACHAHPHNQKILGVLDTTLTLAAADSSLASGSIQMLMHVLLGVLVVSGLSGLFVWRVVHRPLRQLMAGTEELAKGQLGYQIAVDSRDELGEVALSFNQMSRHLQEAYEEIHEWGQTLEARVEQKTMELQRVHEHMLQTERLAATGKLAAIVAHEINNPLSGILTYAKLLQKKLEQGERESGEREEFSSSLKLIQSESLRCGEIVKNLLTFARAVPMNPEWTHLNEIIGDTIRLVEHQLEMNSIELCWNREGEQLRVRLDTAQLKQVLLALIMNAIEAMPSGGTLSVASRALDDEHVEVRVEDNGAGIPAEVLPQIFEPFYSTKEAGRGTGLGLSVSHGIIERHGGSIRVHSEAGVGTQVTVILPVDSLAGAGDASSADSNPVKAR